jgi:hypothetical protein
VRINFGPLSIRNTFGGSASQCKRRFEFGDEAFGGDRAFDDVHKRFTGFSTIIEAISMALPSVVESNWKSIAHTTFGASASIGVTKDTPGRIRADRVLTCRSSSRQEHGGVDIVNPPRRKLSKGARN